MVTNYRIGSEFEWDVVEDLERDGYETIRAAGSHGKIDVLAFKVGQILAIQCKRSGYCRPKERAEVIRLAGILPAAIPLIAWHQLGTRKPQYDRLVGPGSKDRIPFLTDEVIA